MNTADLSCDFPAFLDRGDPLVSVIVPSYRKGAFLKGCLDSILAQSYPHLEVHVVNDGSPDNTSEVARGVQAKAGSRRVVLHEQENGGVSAARNTGFAAAAGRVVLTVDGDDELTPRYVERAVTELRAHRGSLFTAAQENFGERGGQWRPKPYDRYYLRYENSIPTPAVFDKALWIRAGGFKVALGYAEDWEFWVNCSRTDPRIVQSDELLTRYRVNPDGIARTFIDGNWRDCACVVIMANEDLYAVTEILEAHNRFPESASAALDRVRALDRLHPREWLSKLFTGLLAERGGEHERALALYEECIALSAGANWQPFFRRGRILDELGRSKEALEHLHVARTIRPDLGPLVKQRIAMG